MRVTVAYHGVLELLGVVDALHDEAAALVQVRVVLRLRQTKVRCESGGYYHRTGTRHAVVLHDCSRCVLLWYVLLCLRPVHVISRNEMRTLVLCGGAGEELVEDVEASLALSLVHHTRLLKQI